MTVQTENPINDFVNKASFETSKSKNLGLEEPTNLEVIDQELLKSISYVKRFSQRWHADADFREQISIDPYKAVIQYGLKVEVEEIRPLWDRELNNKSGAKLAISPLIQKYQEFSKRITATDLMQSISGSLKNSNFKMWRSRQIARVSSQFKQSFYNGIGFFPACFELSKGCSIGCHFCGISAPRLNDIFFYTSENAKLWREVLELLKEILGQAAGTGFCYWATDPLDNPDYEKFCSDFHAVLGIFPPTTTAQPLKDPTRTRSLLELSKEKGCLHNRFSILSLKMFNQVHEEFSAEELTFVDLVLQNKESDTTKAIAGRARERILKNGEKTDKAFSDQGTIACVSGFLFNMVDRTVKLISPCNASDRWPLGYIVHSEGTFSNINDLKILLEKMISDNMPLTVRPNELINFRSDLKYESLDDGFQLSTRIKTFKFRHDSYLRKLGEVIYEGGKTAQEIASLFNSCGVSPDCTFHYLNLMLEKSVLDDEPKLKDFEAKITSSAR